MTRQEAREHWEEIGLLEDGFDAWCLETTIAGALEMRRTEMSPDWRNFWDRLCVPFLVPALRQLVTYDERREALNRRLVQANVALGCARRDLFLCEKEVAAAKQELRSYPWPTFETDAEFVARKGL